MGDVANEPPTALLADTDVLIDYRESDMSVLEDAGRRIGGLAVLSEVLEEARGLRRRQCASLGIDVIDVEMPTLQAAAEVDAPISYNDRLCFVVCLERTWTCLTNDGALHRLCRRHNVKARYGLGLMVDLVRLGAMDRRRATAIARQMRKANPTHINERVLKRFSRALDGAEGEANSG